MLLFWGYWLHLEFYGIQHDEYVPHFHKNDQRYEAHRQRDLLKIEIAVASKAVVIIVDRTWASRSLEDWLEYLQRLLEEASRPTATLIAESELHEWLYFERAGQKVKDKYVK